MERLTDERIAEIVRDKHICEFCENCGEAEVCIQCEKVKPITYAELQSFWQDLTALVQAKREGRLVELPCKVGDRAFVLDSEDEDGGDDCVFEGVIVAINIGVDGTTVSVGDMEYRCWFSETERRVEDLHADWYLSKDEAEAALAAQEGGSHETDTV